MDAITLLKDDHRKVEELFRRFEKAGDRAHADKRKVVDRIIEELSRHAAIEEQLFYPVSRATVDGVDDTVLESTEEHHIVKWLLSELEDLDPTDERFDAKVTVLIEAVRHHVKEEEKEFFPKVRDQLTRASLTDLGEAMEKAKEKAPTHPHPRLPATAPLNAMSGAFAGVVDRVNDTVSGLTQGGKQAAQELIDRIRQDPKPRSASTRGSTRTRKTADKVRRTASTATDGAQATVRSARAGAKRTAKETASGAKRTASTAKQSAKRATGTAKQSAKRTAGTAKRGAKRTASTARSGAKRTTGTAKRTTTGTAKRTSTARSGAKRTTTGTAKRTSTPRSTAKRTTSTAKRTTSTVRSSAKRTTSTAKRAAKRTAAAR
ncbi:MAG TPA: hemerythrin domain-containing protein [Microthrixaceae bacterium]|nr:hemerythrin domain-containing protein [Microthrixaceae bacterium]